MVKNIWISTSLLIGVGLITSCSVFKNRAPASERDTILAEIYNEVNAAQSLVNTDSVNCHKSFDNLYIKLFNIAGSSTYFDSSDVKSIDEDIKLSFDTRIALKESFMHFDIKNNGALS